jgi:hypothetical protein
VHFEPKKRAGQQNVLILMRERTTLSKSGRLSKDTTLFYCQWSALYERVSQFRGPPLRTSNYASSDLKP